MDDDNVTEAECKERNESYIKELKDLASITAKIGLNTEKLSWSISDPDVGLISQVKILAVAVSTIKETQWSHGARLDGFDRCADDAKEAKKPVSALFFGLLEKVLWSILIALVAVLWATRK